MIAVDISNYTSALTPENLEALKSAGVGLVIVQAVEPPPGYPRGVTRQQIQACLDAGLAVDAYVWLWFDLDVIDIQRKLALLDGLSVRQLWLDVEDTAASKYPVTALESAVAAALEKCDDWQIARGAYVATGLDGTGRRPLHPTGIYSGRWFWIDPRYTGNTTAFADRELWDSNYDDVADATVNFRPYGGWAGARIKQYRGTSSLAGISGLDLNVLSVAEEGELDGSDSSTSNEEPKTEPGDPRDARIQSLLTTIAVMGGDIADSLDHTGAVLHKQAVAKRMNRAQIGGSAANVDAVVAELRRLRAEVA